MLETKSGQNTDRREAGEQKLERRKTHEVTLENPTSIKKILIYSLQTGLK